MKRIRILALLLAMLALTGCSAAKLTLNPQELYALPKLPERYTALNEQIRAILEDGAEYAVPTAGSNIQPVQMTDLDGDGREEALAFFRKADDEKPLKIYIFTATAEGAGYQQTALIEGSGAAFNSIDYSDLDADGRLELLVRWRVSAELQALSVYTLKASGAESLIHTNYVKCTAADLDADGKQELITLRADPEGFGVADCYGWSSGGLALETSARVSMTMAELSRQGRLQTGVLADGSAALFVTGVADGSRAVMDVLTLKENSLQNCMLSEMTGVTQAITLFRGLYPMDINADGITEMPYPQMLPQWDEDSAEFYRIDWKACSSDGKTETVLSTYHDTDQGWYLQLADKWRDRILVSRSTSSEEVSVTFCFTDETRAKYEPFLRITALTGSNRERQALRTGRFVLRRKSDVIYTAELLKGNADWQYGVTEDQVREKFSLIAKEWTVYES